MKTDIKIKMIPSTGIQEFTISFEELCYTRDEFLKLPREKREKLIQEYTDVFSESNPIFFIPYSTEIL